MLLRPEEQKVAAAAAGLVVQTHQRLAGFLRRGLTLAQIDAFVAQSLRDLRTRSCFLHYRASGYPPFPSHACMSVNDVIVHGTAGMSLTPLVCGDVVSIDIGVIHQGWIGDAAWTYVIEEATDLARRLCECGKGALKAGIPELKSDAPLSAWARVVETYVERDCGFFCVEGLGGHGYGRTLHAKPFVANAIPRFPGDWPEADHRLRPGQLLAVEPMVAAGTRKIVQKPGTWPIRTADGSLAVHYEHDVLVTTDGPVILTSGLDDLPLIVGH